MPTTAPNTRQQATFHFICFLEEIYDYQLIYFLTHNTDETQRQTLYIAKWKKAMEEAYNIPTERLPRRKERHLFIQYYNLETEC